MKRNFVILMCFFCFGIMAAEKIIFEDSAKDYSNGSNYLNSDKIDVLIDICSFCAGATADKTVKIIFNSAVYGKEGLISSNAVTVKEPFGQLRYKIGKTGNLTGSIITLGLMNADKKYLIRLNIFNEKINCYTIGGLTISADFKMEVDKLIDLVINYDLKKRSYDLIIDGKKIDSFNFVKNVSGIPSRMTLGSIYWGSGGNGMLESWSWKVSDSSFAEKK